MAEIRIFIKPDLRSQFKSVCALKNQTMSEALSEIMEKFIEESRRNNEKK